MESDIDSENKKIILEKIKKAGSEEYATSWDEKGIPTSKKKSNVKRGKTARARGARFELKVRKDLNDDGWVVDKWSNNIDLEERKIVPAKRKYNPFLRALSIGTGFPDFITLKKIHEGSYDIMGVEVKINGLLSKIEKEKCRFYLDKGIFSKILIAKSIKNGRNINIEYIDFKTRYG